MERKYFVLGIIFVVAVSIILGSAFLLESDMIAFLIISLPFLVLFVIAAYLLTFKHD